MSYLFAALAVIVLGYIAFVFVRLGFVGRLMTLASWDDRIDGVLEASVRRHGDRELIDLVQPLTWNSRIVWTPRHILETVTTLVGCLTRLGVAEGERVAIYKSNNFDYFLFSVAAYRVGGIAVPINLNVNVDIAGRYMESLGVSLLITDCSAWQSLQAHAPATLKQVVLVDGPDAPAGRGVCSLPQLLKELLPATLHRPRGPADPLYIVHTSGTTGVPKGVILKSEGIAQSLRATVLFNTVSPRDVASFALPMNHQVSQLYLHSILLMGVRCIINSNLSDGPALLSQIEQRKPSIFFGFPITYTRLIAAGAEQGSFASVRIWGTTADASHEAQQRVFVPKGCFFRELGIPVNGSLFFDGLGSSEVGIAAVLRVTTPWTKKFERRVGRKAPLGPLIKVADEQGRAVSKGTVGLLMIKGRSMFAGYWNAHDLLYAASRDGWWFTGDVIQEDKDGEMIHLDRAVDVIHTQQGPVYTLPAEEVILKRPGVLDTCVFGVREQADGKEKPAAVVSLRADAKPIAPDALLQELNQQLKADQHLAYLWIVPWEDLPIGATGKTLKRSLRERYNALLQARTTATASPGCTPALVSESQSS